MGDNKLTRELKDCFRQNADSSKRYFAKPAKSGSVTIATSDWNNGVATKTISDLGQYDIIQFYPASSTDKTNATNADIFVSASGTTVTFTATTTPTASITFNYCIIRGTN